LTPSHWTLKLELYTDSQVPLLLRYKYIGELSLRNYQIAYLQIAWNFVVNLNLPDEINSNFNFYAEVLTSLKGEYDIAEIFKETFNEIEKKFKGIMEN